MLHANALHCLTICIQREIRRTLGSLRTDHWPIMGRAFARTDNRFALPIRTLPAFSRYSVRSARIGSMEAARQAGNAHASIATRKRSDAAKRSVRGSRELLPTRAVTRRLRITLRPRPTA